METKWKQHLEITYHIVIPPRNLIYARDKPIQMSILESIHKFLLQYSAYTMTSTQTTVNSSYFIFGDSNEIKYNYFPHGGFKCIDISLFLSVNIFINWIMLTYASRETWWAHNYRLPNWQFSNIDQYIYIYNELNF